MLLVIFRTVSQECSGKTSHLVFTSPLPHYLMVSKTHIAVGGGVHAFNPSTQKAEGQVISD